MQIHVVHGSIQDNKTDTLIVNLFEGVSAPAGATGAVDQALNGAISELITSGDLTGKAGEVGVVYTRGAIPAKRVLVAGLGKPEALDLEGVRQAAAAAIKRARDMNAKEVATVVRRPKALCWRCMSSICSNLCLRRRLKSNPSAWWNTMPVKLPPSKLA
jgi:leucyl aminopeptidase